MSKREAIITIGLAFDFLLPNAERPLVSHIQGWLRLADVDKIIALIEEVANSRSVRSPRHIIFSRLLKLSESGRTNAN